VLTAASVEVHRCVASVVLDIRIRAVPNQFSYVLVPSVFESNVQRSFSRIVLGGDVVPVLTDHPTQMPEVAAAHGEVKPIISVSVLLLIHLHSSKIGKQRRALPNR
jgi:hypothetical protein